MKNKTTAPNLMRAKNYDPTKDYTEWLISEKLDGVRAYWDGQKLISKSGLIFNAPQYFIADFPDFALDGELWIARDKFAELSGIVRGQSKEFEEKWKDVLYCVFDAPLKKELFADRLIFLDNAFKYIYKTKYISTITHIECRGKKHLVNELQRVEKLGGEGLMIQNPNSEYKNGRSKDLLKVKSKKDAEAIVIEHISGKGRNLGRLGALRVKTAAGIVFNIGTGLTDATRDNPPKIGAQVTYSYENLTKNGVPRFAAFLRERKVE